MRMKFTIFLCTKVANEDAARTNAVIKIAKPNGCAKHKIIRKSRKVTTLKILQK